MAIQMIRMDVLQLVRLILDINAGREIELCAILVRRSVVMDMILEIMNVMMEIFSPGMGVLSSAS